MKRVFADTFFYLALMSARDRHHSQARLLASDPGTIFVTTEFVLVEVLDGLSMPANRPVAVRFARELRNDPGTRIVSASSSLLESGLQLYEQRPDKGWSLTDCTSFVAMEQEGIGEALTGDAHFRQAGFVTLMG